MHDGTLIPIINRKRRKERCPLTYVKKKEVMLRLLPRFFMNLSREMLAPFEEARNCVGRWLKEMSEYTIAAEYNGSPVGVSLLSREIAPVTDKNLAMLCNIAVDERFRGRGVGRGLVERACGVCVGKGKEAWK